MGIARRPVKEHLWYLLTKVDLRERERERESKQTEVSTASPIVKSLLRREETDLSIVGQ
jgi:hypothetical protein